jgi:hypothetical protein
VTGGGKHDWLWVRVNDELVLDAGRWVEKADRRGPEKVIQPPATTLYRQVVAYLTSKPDPPVRIPGSKIGREGVAAAALTLRWGSYLAVLLDRDKPVWPEATSAGTSRISDGEMARINIEASAALAEWIDLYRADPVAPVHMQLVDRAIYYLPMPKKRTKPKVTAFAALAADDMAERVIQNTDAARLEGARANAKRYPSRVFSNALVNTAWRNGPVESVHAGRLRGYPLDQRRIRVAEERELINFASQRLALGMAICAQFVIEPQQRPWHEQVLPYGLAEILMVTPTEWTLTESSREVRLPVKYTAAEERAM